MGKIDEVLELEVHVHHGELERLAAAIHLRDGTAWRDRAPRLLLSV